MRNATPTAGVLVGCVLLYSASGLLAQDWPQWRGSNRDAKAAGFTAPKAWPKELTQKWKITVGEGVSTPALVGDKLYVFCRADGNEVLRCLNAATGKELWQDKYETKPPGRPASGFKDEFVGPRSSPTVADGKVVTLGVQGVLSCIDAASGKKVWRKEDAKGGHPSFFTSCSPIVVNGLCIVQLGGEKKGAIVAYDLARGDEKWQWSGDGTAYSSPVLLTLGGAKMIVAETAAKIVALGAADGKLVWETAFPKGQGRTYNACTPMVEGQTIVYSGSGGRGTTAVKVEKQGDALTAKDLWSNKDNGCQFNTPVLKQGLVFGLSDRDALFCINAETGKTAWTVPNIGKGGYGSIVDAGPVLFALSPKSELIVFEPSEKEFKELAKYKVADSETYAYPVIAGNRIYVKGRDTLTLWTIE
jgi:outer membrane protein assembly factor BamB